MVKLLPMMPKRKYMLQSYRKNKKESNHTMNSEEKTHQFFGKSTSNNSNYYKGNTKKKDIALFQRIIKISALYTRSNQRIPS